MVEGNRHQAYDRGVTPVANTATISLKRQTGLYLTFVLTFIAAPGVDWRLRFLAAGPHRPGLNIQSLCRTARQVLCADHPGYPAQGTHWSQQIAPAVREPNAPVVLACSSA
jgi:hypothetical protein